MLTGKEELSFYDPHNGPKLNYLKEYIKETFQYDVEEVTEFKYKKEIEIECKECQQKFAFLFGDGEE